MLFVHLSRLLLESLSMLLLSHDSMGVSTYFFAIPKQTEDLDILLHRLKSYQVIEPLAGITGVMDQLNFSL